MHRRTLLQAAGGLCAVTGVMGTVAGRETHTVHPGESIQHAVQEAESGETIVLEPGEYVGQDVFIDKAVTLRGDRGDPSDPGVGPDAPILEGNGELKNAIVVATGVSDVTIEGLEIRNYAFERGYGTGRGIAAGESTSDVVVRNNYVHDMGWTPVVAATNGGSTHENWTVVGNRITQYPTAAVRMANCPGSRIANNDITGGDHPDGGWGHEGVGILVTSLRRDPEVEHSVRVESIEIENNSIRGPLFVGVEIHAWNDNEGDRPVVLQDLEVSKNDVSGPQIGLTAISSLGARLDEVRIDDNAFSHTEWMAVHLGTLYGTAEHGEFVVSDNAIQHNDNIGIGLTRMVTGRIDITRNEISGNAGDGIGVADDHHPDSLSITENNLHENGSWSLHNYRTEPVPATNNWWGHASGPGGEDGRTNPAGEQIGRGSPISGAITFDPWRRRPVDL